MRFKVYNAKRSDLCVEFESESLETAEKSALRILSRAGYLPKGKKLNRSFGHLHFAERNGRYERDVVYGYSNSDSYGGMQTIKVVLEVVEDSDADMDSGNEKESPITDLAMSMGEVVKAKYNPCNQRTRMELYLLNEVDRRKKVYRDWVKGNLSTSEAYRIAKAATPEGQRELVEEAKAIFPVGAKALYKGKVVTIKDHWFNTVGNISIKVCELNNPLGIKDLSN